MFDSKNYNQKMDKTIDVFSKELNSLRTGRANANMLDIIKVDVYGQKMPVNQLATITTPEPRTINVQVWDLNNVNLIDSAIKKSDLGLNPQIDGQLIRLPVPNLSEERRNEMKKIVKSMGEKCKISIRNIRREILNKKLIEISKEYEKNNESLKSSKKEYEKNKNKFKYYFEIIKIINNFNMGNTCSICVENNVDHFFNPCGHTVCKECVKNIDNNSCFLCRTNIINIKKLYYL